MYVPSIILSFALLSAPAASGFAMTSLGQENAAQEQRARVFAELSEHEVAQEEEDLATIRRILMKDRVPQKYLVGFLS